MSQVYFLHAPSVNLIKIGRSSDPERRFAEVRLISPVSLDVVGVIDGGSDVEAALHQKFSHLRSHGEWFHATADLMRFAVVESLMSAWNKAGKEARDEFLSRIDTPVFDRGAA